MTELQRLTSLKKQRRVSEIAVIKIATLLFVLLGNTADQKLVKFSRHTFRNVVTSNGNKFLECHLEKYNRSQLALELLHMN